MKVANPGRRRFLWKGLGSTMALAVEFDAEQGIVLDERGQEQPRDKERAQRVSRVDEGGDPPGMKGKKGKAVPKRAPSAN